MSIKCTVIIQKEEDWYVATDVTSGVASQGKSIDESLSNLQEALTLYYEDNAPEKSPEPVFVTTMEVAICNGFKVPGFNAERGNRRIGAVRLSIRQSERKPHEVQQWHKERDCPEPYGGCKGDAEKYTQYGRYCAG